MFVLIKRNDNINNDMIINNEKELKKILEAKVVQWLKQLQNDLPTLLHDFIMEDYYKQYIPSDLYERQYRILKSIMTSSIKKTGNVYYLDIYLDPSKVSYDPSIWGYKIAGGVSYGFIKGDTPETVFQNIANGIHGKVEFGVTEGRFWKDFLNAVGHGGVYDIFKKFRAVIQTKSNISF